MEIVCKSVLLTYVEKESVQLNQMAQKREIKIDRNSISQSLDNITPFPSYVDIIIGSGENGWYI